MSKNLENELQTVKAEVADITRRRAKAEADVENLEASIKDSAAQLKEKFGVSSIKEAKKLLAKSEASIESEIEALKLQLKEAVE